MKPVVLIIRDGWGEAPASKGNAVSLAKLPYTTHLTTTYLHTMLTASGEAVGLPRGEDGNTETGHLNLGAGRIVYQDLPRINMAIADGSFFKNLAFLNAIDHIKQTGGKLHLIGLVGSGGVHSNLEHLFALLHFCREHGVTNVFLHLITDGRDSPPTSAKIYMDQIQKEIENLKTGRIATIIGRYYAMDRDLRWERTGKAYSMYTKGEGRKSTSYEEVIENAYMHGQTDEFVEPSVLSDDGLTPVATVGSGDSVIFFNFRIDRTRQLTKAFVLDDFTREAMKTSGFDPYAVEYYKRHVAYHIAVQEPFSRGPKINDLYFVTMTEYEKGLPVSAIAFPPQLIQLPLGRVLSNHDFHQLRATETEKERFVTFYFNGQREEAFPLEDRLIVPSPKVPTYDLKPQMSCYELTDAVIAQIKQNTYQFILINYPNADMVGHTGVVSAAVTACETIDANLARLVPEVLKQDGYCLITADHGNVEEMIDGKTGGIDTEHSTNPVPLLIVGKEFEGKAQQVREGVLADVAPTILGLMGIEKPADMTGRDLLK